MCAFFSMSLELLISYPVKGWDHCAHYIRSHVSWVDDWCIVWSSNIVTTLEKYKMSRNVLNRPVNSTMVLGF